MAIKTLFSSSRGQLVPAADARNHAGAPSYSLQPEAALAQLAATGCFGNTFYVSGEEQLDLVLQAAAQCEPLYIARVALHARTAGYMKDMPALLLALLSTRGPEGTQLMKRIFPRVIDNARMLRNFVQVLRSGQLGRKSLGSAPKKAVQDWLAARPLAKLLADSVGNDPSLADVLKMVHPKPASEEQRAMFGYLLGREHNAALLPAHVRTYEAWKQGDRSAELPNVPFRLLDNLGLGKAEWTAIAARASWQETRMNLNTYERHGVFDDPQVTELIAARLADAKQVRDAKAFPYQLMTTWQAAVNAPAVVRAALQTALDHALYNVPELAGKVVICPDVSGSMTYSAVTGQRKGATSVVRCIDIAGLISAALLRRNCDARVLPFENDVRKILLNPRDSVTTIATQLASLGGGGTNCSAPLALLNREKAKVDVVIYVSDNESWIDVGGRGTATMREWETLRARNPNAKLICVDLTPNIQKQAIDRADILNVGGFSDTVFELIAGFVKDGCDAQHWVRVINQIEV
jgi:60 kDa SS-A/Ro ribonucleoprotein